MMKLDQKDVGHAVNNILHAQINCEHEFIWGNKPDGEGDVYIWCTKCDWGGYIPYAKLRKQTNEI